MNALTQRWCTSRTVRVFKKAKNRAALTRCWIDPVTPHELVVPMRISVRKLDIVAIVAAVPTEETAHVDDDYVVGARSGRRREFHGLAIVPANHGIERPLHHPELRQLRGRLREPL